MFVSTSDLHIRDKLRTTRDGVLTMTRAAVRRARQYTDDVEFSAEDASRTDPDFLCRVVEAAIEEGATTINLPDTVGYAMPAEYAAMFRDVRERVPGSERVVLERPLPQRPRAGGRQHARRHRRRRDAGGVHRQRHRRAGRKRGAGGDRHGQPGPGRRRWTSSCNVESREIYRTSQLLSYLTGVFPQPNKAIVGRNAFAHEAGIHQHGMLQNGLTYEIIRPEMVGIPRSTLVLGKHSGRHALERRYQELGYQLNEQELAEVYQGFTALAERKREILDEDLLALLHESFHDAPEEFQLTHLRVVCGSVTATAEVRMTGPWAGERSARGTGDGPIAAAFTAVSEILGRQSRC